MFLTCDTCASVRDPLQLDSNNDGVGDACNDMLYVDLLAPGAAGMVNTVPEPSTTAVASPGWLPRLEPGGVDVLSEPAMSAPSLLWWSVLHSPEGWPEVIVPALNLMPVPGLLALRWASSSRRSPTPTPQGRKAPHAWTYPAVLRLHLSNMGAGWGGTGLAALLARGRIVSVPRPSAFLVAAALCLTVHLLGSWVHRRVTAPAPPEHR